MSRHVFYPGRMAVSFRKGPRGFLRQDPSDAAKVLKDNPSLQDKSAAVREELVRQNALTVVRQRGGDPSDTTEVSGDYILQFGKYKGKSFRWLLENDIGYTIYLIRNQQGEEAAGVFMAAGHNKDSLLSFINYSLMFREIQSLLNYEEHKPVMTAAASEDDQLVGFGTCAYSTWREVWESREDGYASFILKKKNCTAGTKMHKLQLYLKKKLQPPTVTPLMSHTSPVMSHASHAPAEAIVMDEDEELERMMLSISPSKQHVQSSVSASSSSSSSARLRERGL
ncbi:uncharacterized protein LOC130208388 [Pseudoliparis swirei]|uniref:uncharacterized protein LOC130208388 n=1 Tax=Pseudoliparis swirei TaxID=2059687 RepID=UPI0024BECAC1|nr:uncharacterized protein LOC130208388 [Pseudoliparis swirei]XP_056293450.1 uncharacterized protein LOC130208388 [Pseudoliparis swirei]XP_056293451.1 uncharacterized protein LOC130208388 [Pseudoliparis swirei]XP_056293452.1 uncharacterized protein LOC130208388 [Pseudoliparis swirei]